MARTETKTDAQQEIVDRIIVALEAGPQEWKRTWKTLGISGMPRNGSSKRGYNGLNIWLLALRGYSDARWFTYKQAAALDAQVRKGEKGTKVFFWQFLPVWEDASGKQVRKPTKAQIKSGAVKKVREIPMFRVYTVFNAMQIDGLAEVTVPDVTPGDKYADAAEVLDALGAEVIHGGDEASYSPSLDCIRLPLPGQFDTIEDYWATRAHETTHWTGHKSRCNRDLKLNRFGDEKYAMEELVAELGSAMLCGLLGIDGEMQHPSYIANWLKVLRGDKYAVFTAATAAQKAVNFIMEGGNAATVTPEESEAGSEMAQAA